MQPGKPRLPVCVEGRAVGGPASAGTCRVVPERRPRDEVVASRFAPSPGSEKAVGVLETLPEAGGDPQLEAGSKALYRPGSTRSERTCVQPLTARRYAFRSVGLVAEHGYGEIGQRRPGPLDRVAKQVPAVHLALAHAVAEPGAGELHDHVRPTADHAEPEARSSSRRSGITAVVIRPPKSAHVRFQISDAPPNLSRWAPAGLRRGRGRPSPGRAPLAAGRGGPRPARRADEATLTVRGACKPAGLAARYFYESFADRDALAAAVSDKVVAEIAQTTLAAVPDAPPSRRPRSARVWPRSYGPWPRIRAVAACCSPPSCPTGCWLSAGCVCPLFAALLAAEARAFYGLRRTPARSRHAIPGRRPVPDADRVAGRRPARRPAGNR